MTSERKPGLAGILGELALVFLRLGCTAFGGPVAHISIMEHEFVHRRHWVTREQLMDLISASNMIPGPNSTELALHLGRLRAGSIGLLIAGCCFIAPAAILSAIAAWFYVRYGRIPEVQGILYGVKPVIVAIVLQALFRLRGAALKTHLIVTVSCAGAVLSFCGVNELAILFGSGALVVFIQPPSVRGTKKIIPLVSGVGTPAGWPFFAALGVPLSVVPLSIWHLCWVFFKIGAVLFGSGYVLIAFLRADFVDRLGWITESQLMDSIAVGQLTPGPLLCSATFLGYLLEGPIGGLAATVAIFLPAFIMVWISGPLIPRLRSYAPVAAFLDGANGASFALIAVTAWRVGNVSIIDWRSGALFLVASLVLSLSKVNSAWIILGAGGIGALLSR